MQIAFIPHGIYNLINITGISKLSKFQSYWTNSVYPPSFLNYLYYGITLQWRINKHKDDLRGHDIRLVTATLLAEEHTCIKSGLITNIRQLHLAVSSNKYQLHTCSFKLDQFFSFHSGIYIMWERYTTTADGRTGGRSMWSHIQIWKGPTNILAWLICCLLITIRVYSVFVCDYPSLL